MAAAADQSDSKHISKVESLEALLLLVVSTTCESSLDTLDLRPVPRANAYRMIGT